MEPVPCLADLPDKDLALRVAAGERAAFDVLMNRHQTSLIRWVWTLVGDADEAADVAQDAFLQAYAARDRYDSRYAFKTWLYAIARNRALTTLRRRKRQVRQLHDDAPDQPPGTTWADLAVDETTPDARAVASAAERAAWLHRALDRMDDAHAEVLRLKYFGGLKSREIAELMGLEVGTVWSRVHHGLAKMKAFAAEVGYDEF